MPRDWFSSDFLVFDLTVLSWTIPNSRQCPKHLHLDIQLCHICVSFKPPSQVSMQFPGGSRVPHSADEPEINNLLNVIEGRWGMWGLRVIMFLRKKKP